MNQTPYQTPNTDISWQELRQLVESQAELIRTFQTSPKSCNCHVIDAGKISILMWAEKNTPQFQAKCAGCGCHAQNFILKQANQKFISLIRIDKHKNIYWKYRNLVESEKVPTLPQTPKCLDCKEEIEIIGERDKSTPLRCFECEKKAQNQPQTSPDPKIEVKENYASNQSK